MKVINKILHLLNSGSKRTIKLKKNILASYIIKGVSMLISLVKVPLLLSYLDSEKYGVWLTLASMVMWVQYFDLGLGHGLRNKYAEAIALNNKQQAKGLVSTAYLSMSVLMLLLIFVFLIVSYYIDWNSLLNVTSVSSTELRNTIILTIIMFSLRFVFQLITVLLKAIQKSAISDAFLPIESILSLLIIVVLLYSPIEDSLFWTSFALSMPPVLVLLMATIYFFHKDFLEYRPSLQFYNKKYLKDIYILGLKFFIGQMCALVLFGSTNLVISRVMSPNEVTIYNIARTYFELPLTFFTMVLTPFWSAITEAYVRNEYDWIKKGMRRLLQLATLFSLCLLLMLAGSQYAFHLWIGGKVLVPWQICVAFAIYNISVLYMAPYNYFLNGVGKLNLSVNIAIFKTLAFLPTAIFLSTQYGLTGLIAALFIINSMPNILAVVQYKKLISKEAMGIWNR